MQRKTIWPSSLKLMHLSFAFPWIDPWDTPREPTGTQEEWNGVGISFFPTGQGSCLVLESSLLDHEDIPTGFVRVLAGGISL